METTQLQKLTSEIERLSAKDQIRDVLYQYCRAVDRGDPALMKSCYHPDGRDDHGFFSGSGHDFADYVMPILAELECSIHTLSNPLIEMSGNTAFVETQWSVIHRLRRNGKLTDIWDQGRYLDEFEQRQGQWRILNRVVVMDAERWMDTVNLLDLIPDTHPQKVRTGRRNAGDPVFRLHQVGALVRPGYAMPDLWTPYRKLLLLPKRVLHWLGQMVRARNETRTETRSAVA